MAKEGHGGGVKREHRDQGRKPQAPASSAQRAQEEGVWGSGTRRAPQGPGWKVSWMLIKKAPVAQLTTFGPISDRPYSPVIKSQKQTGTRQEPTCHVFQAQGGRNGREEQKVLVASEARPCQLHLFPNLSWTCCRLTSFLMYPPPVMTAPSAPALH